MSGVNYANSSVHKSDLQLIENYAVSLSGGGSGGSVVRDYIHCFGSNVAVTNTTTFASLTVLPLISTQSSSNFTLLNNEVTYTGATTKNFLCNFNGTLVVGGAVAVPIDYGDGVYNQIWVYPWKGTPSFSSLNQNLTPDCNYTTSIVNTQAASNYRSISYSFVFSLSQNQKIKFFANMNASLGGITYTFTDAPSFSLGSLSLSSNPYTITINEI